MRRAALAGLLLMTTGCAPVPPSDDAGEMPVHGGTGRACEAARAQMLIGQAASAALGAEALRLSGAGTLRWLPPGAIVTMDYREDRLNVELDANNRVTRVRCG